MKKLTQLFIFILLLTTISFSQNFKVFGYYANHHYQWSWPHEMDTTAVDIWIQFGTGPTNPATTPSPWIGVVGGCSAQDSIDFLGLSANIAPQYQALYPPGNLQTGEDMAAGFVRMVHNAGKKILVSYAALQWGAHPNTKDYLDSILVKGNVAIDTHAKALVDWAHRRGYQGIDINWEFPNQAFKAQNTYFISRLRFYLDQWAVKGILTTTVLNANKNDYRSYTWQDTTSQTYPYYFYYGNVIDYILVEGGFGSPGAGATYDGPPNAIFRPTNCAGTFDAYVLADTQYATRTANQAYTGALGWASLLRNSGHPEAVGKIVQFFWTEVLMTNHEPNGCAHENLGDGVPGIVRPITLGMVYGGYAKKPGVTWEFDPVSKARWLYVPQSANAMFGDWGTIGWWDSTNIPIAVNLLKSNGVGGAILYSTTAGYVNKSGSGDNGNFTASDYNGDRNFVVHTFRKAAGSSVVLPVDSIAPTVSFTSPSAGATLSGTTTITVSASDNVGVTNVVLSVGATQLATLSTAPYSYSWNTTTVVNGTYLLSARAIDAANNSKTVTVSVTVNNTIVIPPSVGDQVLYDDALQSPWIDGSYNVTNNFNNTTPVYLGTKSIKVTAAAFGGLQLKSGVFSAPSINVDKSKYSAIEFDIYPTVAMSINTYFNNDSRYASANNIKAVPANVWTVVNYPLSVANPYDSTISYVGIQNWQNVAIVYYVDNIHFVAKVQPLPTVSIVSSALFDTVGRQMSFTATTSATVDSLQWYRSQTGQPGVYVFTAFTTPHTLFWTPKFSGSWTTYAVGYKSGTAIKSNSLNIQVYDSLVVVPPPTCDSVKIATNAYNSGYSVGYTTGYNTGKASVNTDSIFKAGVKSVYVPDSAKIATNAYNSGYAKGYSDGYTVGYNAGKASINKDSIYQAGVKSVYVPDSTRIAQDAFKQGVSSVDTVAIRARVLGQVPDSVTTTVKVTQPVPKPKP